MSQAAEDRSRYADSKWREARQAELNELGGMSGQRYILLPNGSIRIEQVNEEEGEITVWIRKSGH